MQNLKKYQIELNTYSSELREKLSINQKKLDTYAQAGKMTEENANEAQDKNNYENEIYDLKQQLKEIEVKVEEKRHHDISVTEHHLKVSQFANQILYNLYGNSMPASELTKVDEIKEKAEHLMTSIQGNLFLTNFSKH